LKPLLRNFTHVRVLETNQLLHHFILGVGLQPHGTIYTYVDFTGPFLGKHYFIIVDAHSKWPEVIPMNVTSAEKTVNELRKVFTTHGLPC